MLVLGGGRWPFSGLSPAAAGSGDTAAARRRLGAEAEGAAAACAAARAEDEAEQRRAAARRRLMSSLRLGQAVTLPLHYRYIAVTLPLGQATDGICLAP